MRFLKINTNENEFEIIDLLKVNYVKVEKMDYNPKNLNREQTYVIRFYFGGTTFCSYVPENKNEIEEIINVWEEENETSNNIKN